MRPLVVISRSSTLAKVQVEEALGVLSSISKAARLPAFEKLFVESLGDRNKQFSLLDGSAPPDLFTRELDEVLLSGKADCAVHSAKDLSLPLNAELEVIALLEAKDRSDSLVVRAGMPSELSHLPPAARVGTSSPTRKTELERFRPDLTVVGIRGTIEERLNQLDRGDFDAIICATCALQRLGMEDRISMILPFETHPLQGHLAVTALRHRTDLKDLWKKVDVRTRWGRVYMVGAGPGDPELLTLKAQRILREADIIYHDSLANPVILEGLKAEIQFVGKRKDFHGVRQQAINSLLYESAIQGKRVVRLKGGDPMLFGRATEEMDYLEQRMVELELIPGVSSAFAASSYTQIPLTEREVGASVAFCLGYPPEKIQVPTADSLVYFMGASTLSTIVAKNLESGKSPSTPVALVHNASLPDQKMWISDLGSLSEEKKAYPTPLLIVIGPVVRSGRLANWYQTRPLIWYTGTNPDHFLRPARLIHVPLIEIRPIKDYRELDASIKEINRYQWVIFTSRYTVEHFFARLDMLGYDVRSFSGVKVAAVGHATANELRARGLKPDLVPGLESSEGLVTAFETELPQGDLNGKRVFLPCSDQALPVIRNGLTKLGASVERVTVYENKAIETCPAIPIDELDEVVLTSPSTAKVFHSFFPDLPGQLILTPMGAQTRKTLRELYPARNPGPDLLLPAGENKP